MHRRTLIKACSTAILSGLCGIPEVWASCQGSYGLPSSTLGSSFEEPIEALFDRKYGEAHWQFSKDMALRVTHPDNVEYEETVTFNVRLDALPPGMARCMQVEIYRRKEVRISSRTGRSLHMANYRVASCYPANVLPMEYGTRYRDSRGSGDLYVALSFLTLTGVTRVLVYRHPRKVTAYGGCTGAVYILPDTEQQQAEAAIKEPSKVTVKTRFRNMQDHLVFIMLVGHNMQTGFAHDKQGLVIPADYLTLIKIMIRGKVVARCELGPSSSSKPFIHLTLPPYPKGTDVQVAYEDILGNHQHFDTTVEY